MSDEVRSRRARHAAETALVRVVHHYGALPEFVVLGGLVPDLLCSNAAFRHAGTTDIDVQVDVEVAAGAVNAARLEQALRNAEFEPDDQHVWRWRAGPDNATLVKFELLADDDSAPSESILRFDDCERLGAVNLRGTGFAARDTVVRDLRAKIGGVEHAVQIKTTGLAGFLMAKVAAAHSRRKEKDWYDIAFVLLHNDLGGVDKAAELVHTLFGQDVAAIGTALDDLSENFADVQAQGPLAYAEQMAYDHPELDRATLRADAVVAVRAFHRFLRQG